MKKSNCVINQYLLAKAKLQDWDNERFEQFRNKLQVDFEDSLTLLHEAKKVCKTDKNFQKHLSETIQANHAKYNRHTSLVNQLKNRAIEKLKRIAAKAELKAVNPQLKTN